MGHPPVSSAAESGASLARVSLTARIDRLPVVTRTHRVWLVLLGLIFLGDIADIYALSYAAPAIRAARLDVG